MVRPKAPPAKARVVSGLLSFISLVLSWCVSQDHLTKRTLEFAQAQVGDRPGIALGEPVALGVASDYDRKEPSS